MVLELWTSGLKEPASKGRPPGSSSREHPRKEVTPMGTAPVFASVSEAMDMVRAGLAFVTAADATELTCEEQAETLRALERANSVAAAARTSVLGAFTAGKGYSADADYSARSWLMHQTGITRGAAVFHTAWVKRAARHPEIYAAMAAEDMSESYARTLATWTDKLPPDKRDEADKLLADEARDGMELRDLAVLAAEILARCRPDEPDEDPAAWWRAGCCRSGPGSRSRPWSTSAWETWSTSTAAGL